MQARNLAKLDAAGVRIGFGTDAGVSVGWTAHTELADMVAAGHDAGRGARGGRRARRPRF